MLDDIRGRAGGRPERPRSFPASLAAASRGLSLATRAEPNFRSQLIIAAGALLAAWAAGFGAGSLSVLAATIGLVLAAELLNTAVEMLTDLLHPGAGPQAAAIKDISAAGVLVTAVCAAAVGVFLFAPLWGAGLAVVRGLPLLLAAVCLAAFVTGAVRSARRAARDRP